MRPHYLESRMREIRLSGSEGGVAFIRHPYPYSVLGFMAMTRAQPLLRTAPSRFTVCLPFVYRI